MSAYLDASVLVALFVNDALTDRADRYLRDHPSVLIVSDFAAAEFSSAVATRTRMRHLNTNEALAAFSSFDTWFGGKVERAHATSADIASATQILRRLDLGLRTPDAIHIAIVQRIGAELFTFDKKMAESARALGVNVIE